MTGQKVSISASKFVKLLNFETIVDLLKNIKNKEYSTLKYFEQKYRQ